MNGIKVSRAELEWAARVYRTNKDAAAALGITAPSFARACKREGIETPHGKPSQQRDERQKV